MDHRTNPPRRNAPAPRPNSGILTLAGCLVLGICIIIAASIVSSPVKKLAAAVEAQTFSSSFSAPSNITVKNTAEKNYFNETDAAAYLNITVDELKAAITKKEIKEYIKTSEGYSISQKVLDDYFEDRAYQQLKENNSD